MSKVIMTRNGLNLFSFDVAVVAIKGRKDGSGSMYSPWEEEEEEEERRRLMQS